MNQKRILWLGLGVMVCLWLFTGTAVAAEMVNQELYRVPENVTIEDDLYVSANEIYIEGVVQGDLLASGGYLEINGTVEGDLLFVGLGLLITGDVGGDVRVATGGLALSGSVGEDLVAFTWGDDGLPFPLGVPNMDLAPGLLLDEGSLIGQDAWLTGGSAVVAGQIGRNLRAETNRLFLSGQVGGDADISAPLLEISSEASVGGELVYATTQPQPLPDGLAEEVRFQSLSEAVESVTESVLQRLLQVVSLLTGFAILGWVLLRWSPRALSQPVQVLFTYPVRSAWLGFAVGLGFLIFPFATFLLATAVGIFWGFLPALVTAVFILSALALVWIFSPLVIGLWLGLRFTPQPLNALLIGVLAVILLTGLPILGFFISFMSFILTLGSLLLVLISPPVPPVS